MKKNLIITILTDKNSYMNTFNKKLKQQLKELKHEVRLINKKEELRNGDILFLFSCFELIENQYLSLHKYNIVIHESDLPQGKGWSPASWQILEGQRKIVLTAFEATLSVDSGDIYYKDFVQLEGSELAPQWRGKIAFKKMEMCLNIVQDFHILKSSPQVGTESFYAKRCKNSSKLDVNKSILDQFPLLQIVDNDLYPAFFELHGKKYILKIYEEKDLS